MDLDLVDPDLAGFGLVLDEAALALVDLGLVPDDPVPADLAFLDPPTVLRFLDGVFLAAGLSHFPQPVHPPLHFPDGRLLAVLTVSPHSASTSASSLGAG